MSNWPVLAILRSSRAVVSREISRLWALVSRGRLSARSAAELMAFVFGMAGTFWGIGDRIESVELRAVAAAALGLAFGVAVALLSRPALRLFVFVKALPVSVVIVTVNVLVSTCYPVSALPPIDEAPTAVNACKVLRSKRDWNDVVIFSEQWKYLGNPKPMTTLLPNDLEHGELTLTLPIASGLRRTLAARSALNTWLAHFKGNCEGELYQIRMLVWVEPVPGLKDVDGAIHLIDQSFGSWVVRFSEWRRIPVGQWYEIVISSKTACEPVPVDPATGVACLASLPLIVEVLWSIEGTPDLAKQSTIVKVRDITASYR